MAEASVLGGGEMLFLGTRIDILHRVHDYPYLGVSYLGYDDADWAVLPPTPSSMFNRFRRSITVVIWPRRFITPSM